MESFLADLLAIFQAFVPAIAGFLLALLSALLGTRTFVDFLDQWILRGKPREVPDELLRLFNNYLMAEEVHVHGVIKEQPKLIFQPYTRHDEVCKGIDQGKVETFHVRQLNDSMPDDPHVYIFSKTPVTITSDTSEQELHAYVAGQYSQLLALPKSIKDQLLIVGANNLVIDPYRNHFIFHKRAPLSETQGGKLHGFGGGYLPYWNGGDKSLAVRRDDCKSLRCTAMRELHEESGFLSLKHVPEAIAVMEERHTRDPSPDGKFGYLTFFFITLLDKKISRTRGSDPKEGSTQPVEITASNILKMITEGKFQAAEIHPQLKAMMLLWVFMGCPGLHYLRRRWLTFRVRKRLLQSIESRLLGHSA